MALNFRLNYNNGFDYVDLFPRTQLKAIKGAENSLKFSKLTVRIPAFTGFQQVVNIALNERQKVAPFYAKLSVVNETTQAAYDTIDQIEIKDNQLIVTRLGEGSLSKIAVDLLFMESGVDGK